MRVRSQTARPCASDGDGSAGEGLCAHVGAILDSICEGVLLVRAGRVVQANPAAARLCGQTAQSLTGQDVASLFALGDRPGLAGWLVGEPAGASTEATLAGGNRVRLRVLQAGHGPDRLILLADLSEQVAATEEAARLGRIVEESRTEIFLVRAETMAISYANRSACKHLGYSSAELAEMSLTEIQPNASADSVRALLTPLLEGRQDRVGFVTRHRRRDGSTYPVEIHVQLAAEADGGSLVAYAHDITDRQRHEQALADYTRRLKVQHEQARRDAETRAVLLREVNHRVKNNLSAIIGMLYAELRSGGEEERPLRGKVLEGLVGRVRGLATVHEMLSASQWQPIRLSDLAREVVSATLHSLPGSTAARLDVGDSDVTLVPAQASHVALVLNELATNSTKHATRPAAPLSLRVQVSRNGSHVRLVYRDDGPGYPESVLAGETDSRSVGWDLMHNIARKSLRGDLQLGNDGGAVACLEFKIRKESRS